MRQVPGVGIVTEWEITPSATGRFFVVHPKGRRPAITDAGFPTEAEAQEYKRRLEQDPPSRVLPDLARFVTEAFNK